MIRRRLTLSVFPLLVCLPPVVLAQQGMDLQTLWQQAEEARTLGQFDAAIQAYRSVLVQYPDSPEAGIASVRLAQALHRSGHLPEAVAAYEGAIAGKLNDYWMTVALFGRAVVCLKSGCHAEVRDSVQRLRSEFPESSFTAKAGILEAELNHLDAAAAEGFWQKEQEASPLVDAAKALADQKQDQAALDLLGRIVAGFPGTPAVLRAEEMQAHLFLRTAQRERAWYGFKGIVDGAGAYAPKARIVDRAKTRMAAMNHNGQRRHAALAQYRELMESSDPAIASNAAVQVAGREFELLQREKVRGGAISDERWDAVRESCAKVLRLPSATLEERATADLMIIETYEWQKKGGELLAAGDQFLRTYTADSLKKQIAIAHLLVGEERFMRLEMDQAIPHFRWVVDAYPDKKEFWPPVDSLARAHFMLWRGLRRAGAPPNEWRSVGETIVTRFPETVYASFVGNAN